ncbi:hypothetical protein BO94DRAFT_129987 [Aspergillus sclerotioniger CBS 115572]|uniref:Oxidoreductase acuF-like C2H2 type zinc-finger domain-containing protein n=1 Tax=Aspergillus sclerotioniger CBS 115572 TaxID=1450535 RepID=A0A317XBS4_9EURO|nr:hypothetical protein BO94DRAFT_129987 [Aspergillus sclerotioniger CBS 115572]PWY95561.1 hypothetical protein BO94DRAFT_129987 [Aspergillus sclerotioniger CBS 115572]
MAAEFSALAQSCLSLWGKLVSSGDLAAFSHEVPHSFWEDGLGRMSVCISDIGAHPIWQPSLHSRLRDASHIKYEVKRHLLRLKWIHDCLQNELFDLSDEESENGGEKMTDETMETYIQGLYYCLHDTIDSLYQLIRSVRLPACHNIFTRVKRADAAHFEYYDRRHVQSKYPNISQAISDRLGEAISIRRAVLQYYERLHTEISVISDAVSIRTLSEATTIKLNQEPTETLEVDAQSMMPQTLCSESVVQGGSGSAIPLPPAGSTYGAPFTCPYCFFIVNVKDQNEWIEHIFSDLKPYVCVLPDCQTPNHLYECRREWYAHMHDEHMTSLSVGEVSKCLLCGCEVTPGEVLEEHLAKHLEELALFALPRANVTDEEISRDNLPVINVLRGIERLSVTTRVSDAMAYS